MSNLRHMKTGQKTWQWKLSFVSFDIIKSITTYPHACRLPEWRLIHMLHTCVAIYSLNTNLPFLFLLVHQLLIFYSAQIENMHENRWMGTLADIPVPATCTLLHSFHSSRFLHFLLLYFPCRASLWLCSCKTSLQFANPWVHGSLPVRWPCYEISPLTFSTFPVSWRGDGAWALVQVHCFTEGKSELNICRLQTTLYSWRDHTLRTCSHAFTLTRRLSSLCATLSPPWLFIHSSPLTHSKHMQNTDKYQPCLETDKAFASSETLQQRVNWHWF